MSSNPPVPSPASVLYCSHCGASVTPGDAYCSKCSARQPAAYVESAGTERRPQYAGFWIRFAAWLLDTILLGIAFTPVQLGLFGVMGVSLGMGGQQDPARMMAVLLPAVFLAGCLQVLLHWLYEAFLTSSSKQATVGKMACGLRVTDLQGRRLTFARASGRFFAKIISSMTLLIGYIMAGFTERKQALHDFIAGTYVLRD